MPLKTSSKAFETRHDPGQGLLHAFLMSFACISLTLMFRGVLYAQPLHIPIETYAQDRAFSEFNHHLAGGFLLAIGVMAFLSHALTRLKFLSMVWPFLLLLEGVYLAFMSDPDTWPMGALGLIDALLTDPEVLQHKLFSLMFILLSVVEFQRSRGRLMNGFLRTWSFPILALSGALLVIFHGHAGAAPGMETIGHMHAESHSMTMEKIEKEHLWFALTGAGVAFFKFIYDGRWFRGNRFLPFAWPLCISVLGILLLVYSE